MKRKKSTWMKGFVIPPKRTPIELASMDSVMRLNDYQNKQRKRSR